MKRRLFALLMCLVLLAGMVPGFALAEGEPAPAEEENQEILPPQQPQIEAQNAGEFHLYYVRGDVPSAENLPPEQSYSLPLGENESIRVSSQSPTAEGYDFLYWQLADGEKTFAPGDTLAEADYDGLEALTLKAIWQEAPRETPPGNELRTPVYLHCGADSVESLSIPGVVTSPYQSDNVTLREDLQAIIADYERGKQPDGGQWRASFVEAVDAVPAHILLEYQKTGNQETKSFSVDVNLNWTVEENSTISLKIRVEQRKNGGFVAASGEVLITPEKNKVSISNIPLDTAASKEDYRVVVLDEQDAVITSEKIVLQGKEYRISVSPLTMPETDSANAGCNIAITQLEQKPQTQNPVLEYDASSPVQSQETILRWGNEIIYKLSLQNPADSPQKLTVEPSLSEGLSLVELHASYQNANNTETDFALTKLTENRYAYDSFPAGAVGSILIRARVNADVMQESGSNDGVFVGIQPQICWGADTDIPDNWMVIPEPLKNKVNIAGYSLISNVDKKVVSGVTVNQTLVSAGERVSYKFSVKNDFTVAKRVYIKPLLDAKLSIDTGTQPTAYVYIQTPAVTRAAGTTAQTAEVAVDNGVYSFEIPAGTQGELRLPTKVAEDVRADQQLKINAEYGYKDEDNAPITWVSMREHLNTVDKETNPVKSSNQQAASGSSVGRTLSVHDKIKYTITFHNHHTSRQTVVITDKLDDGLTTSDSHYNSRNKTLSWTLEVDPHTTAMVSFEASVTNGVKKQQISNTATVKIGDDNAKTTNAVTNRVKISVIKSFGDNSHLELYVAAAALSGVGLLAIGGYALLKKRKH